MKLSEIKDLLPLLDTVSFELPDKTMVPEHFHVTEVGVIAKDFIDCGGTVRSEKVANFQLWDANDTDHRLKPAKLLNIINLSERVLGMEDLEIEVEYQGTTIGKYDLGHNGVHFTLLVKKTACLASDKCDMDNNKQKVKLSDLNAGKEKTSCSPGGGCC